MDQGELFPDLVIQPTPAMSTGSAELVACRWCGSVLYVTSAIQDTVRGKLGACPACTMEDWRRIGIENTGFLEELPWPVHWEGPFYRIVKDNERSE